MDECIDGNDADYASEEGDAKYNLGTGHGMLNIVGAIELAGGLDPKPITTVSPERITILDVSRWEVVGSTSFVQTSASSFRIQSDTWYWAGVKYTGETGCDYHLIGEARLASGKGYGIAVRTTVQGNTPLGRAFSV